MDGHDQTNSLLHLLGCQTIPSLTTCKIVYKGTVSSLTPGFLGFGISLFVCLLSFDRSRRAWRISEDLEEELRVDPWHGVSTWQAVVSVCLLTVLHLVRRLGGPCHSRYRVISQCMIIT